MKVNMIKLNGGVMSPVDDADGVKLQKLTNNEIYEIDVKIKQNGKLHRKIFSFFSFCANHYYGDNEAHKDTYQLDYVRKNLTIAAGYCKQMYNREGTAFEVVPLSLSYDKMSPEDRSDFYSRIVNAAIVNVFNDTTDENILNQLYNYFR